MLLGATGGFLIVEHADGDVVMIVGTRRGGCKSRVGLNARQVEVLIRVLREPAAATSTPAAIEGDIEGHGPRLQQPRSTPSESVYVPGQPHLRGRKVAP